MLHTLHALYVLVAPLEIELVINESEAYIKEKNLEKKSDVNNFHKFLFEGKRETIRDWQCSAHITRSLTTKFEIFSISHFPFA